MAQPTINPYASPAEASPALRTSGGREWCAVAGMILSLIVPGLFVWDRVFSWPLPSIMENVEIQIAVTLAVFVLTLISIPLGYVGLRSRLWVCGALALVVGSVLSLLMFKFKFAPVLWN